VASELRRYAELAARARGGPGSAARWAVVCAGWAPFTPTKRSARHTHRALGAALRACRGRGMYGVVAEGVAEGLERWLLDLAARPRPLAPDEDEVGVVAVERRPLRSNTRRHSSEPGRGCPHRGPRGRAAVRLVLRRPGRRPVALTGTVRTCCLEDPSSDARGRLWHDFVVWRELELGPEDPAHVPGLAQAIAEVGPVPPSAERRRVAVAVARAAQASLVRENLVRIQATLEARGRLRIGHREPHGAVRAYVLKPEALEAGWVAGWAVPFSAPDAGDWRTFPLERLVGLVWPA